MLAWFDSWKHCCNFDLVEFIKDGRYKMKIPMPKQWCWPDGGNYNLQDNILISMFDIIADEYIRSVKRV